jgi:hypothetical protein
MAINATYKIGLDLRDPAIEAAFDEFLRKSPFFRKCQTAEQLYWLGFTDAQGETHSDAYVKLLEDSVLYSEYRYPPGSGRADSILRAILDEAMRLASYLHPEGDCTVTLTFEGLE